MFLYTSLWVRTRSSCFVGKFGTYSWRLTGTALTLAAAAREKIDCYIFMSRRRYIPFNNTFGWSVVVSCACKLILMFRVVFLLVGNVHKYDVNFVLNWTHNTWRPLECDKDMFFDRTYFFVSQRWPIGNWRYPCHQGHRRSRQSMTFQTGPRAGML